MGDMELFAEVALIEDAPSVGLYRGQVGAIVDVLGPDACIVEFIDREGYTYALETLPTKSLFRLYHQPLREAA